MPPKSLPLKQALLDAMSVAGNSIEAAQYLVTRVKKILTDAKLLEKSQDFMQKIEDFAKYTTFKLLSQAQSWSGQQTETVGFKNMQGNMAVDALKKLDSLSGDIAKVIKFDFAIDNNANIVRGFSAQGKPLDANAVASLDILFNAWLAEHNIISKNGTLFQANPDGEIQVDANGKEIKANSNLVKQLIAEKSFSDYAAKKGVKLVSEEHPFPSAQHDKQTQKAAHDAIEAVSSDEETMRTRSR